MCVCVCSRGTLGFLGVSRCYQQLRASAFYGDPQVPLVPSLCGLSLSLAMGSWYLWSKLFTDMSKPVEHLSQLGAPLLSKFTPSFPSNQGCCASKIKSKPPPPGPFGDVWRELPHLSRGTFHILSRDLSFSTTSGNSWKTDPVFGKSDGCKEWNRNQPLEVGDVWRGPCGSVFGAAIESSPRPCRAAPGLREPPAPGAAAGAGVPSRRSRGAAEPRVGAAEKTGGRLWRTPERRFWRWIPVPFFFNHPSFQKPATVFSLGFWRFSRKKGPWKE